MYFYILIKGTGECVMKKYEVLYNDLLHKIQHHEYPENSFLPSEVELTQRYLVSRDTVRKALSLLSQNGYIHTNRGSGSKVLHKKQVDFPVSQLTSYQELVCQLGLHSTTNVISVEKLVVDSELSLLTHFAEGESVWRIIRQRIVDHVASVLDTDYLLCSIVPHMSREIAQQSIYHYLEHELQLAIRYAKKEITIEAITQQDALFLDIGSERHVVCVQSNVYLDDHVLFQFTMSRHKLDQFRFVDYATRPSSIQSKQQAD